MRKLIACLALLPCIANAAGGIPPEYARTASWYADNPEIMRRVVAACKNDPGHGRKNADCQNAMAGEIVFAERDGTRNLGGNSRSFWKEFPGLRHQRATICRSVKDPVDRRNAECDIVESMEP
jgi:hypothetical protein